MSRPMTSAEEAVWAATFVRKFKDSEGDSPKHLHVPGKDEEYRAWHAGIVREALEHAAHAVDALRRAVETGALEEGYGRDSSTVRYARGATAFHPDRLDHEFWVLHSPYPDGTWRGLHKGVDVMLSAETMQPLRYGPPYEVQPPTLDGAPLLFTSRTDAEEFAKKHNVVGMVPACVILTTPFVRRPLTSLEEKP